jgi:ADP-ribosyl-[dinitrogen reductase] hydrolase
MLGGGVGNIAPGQWSDDTEMACAIAGVAATGADMRTAAALDAIAGKFLDWYAEGPPDVGMQTATCSPAPAPVRGRRPGCGMPPPT